MRVLYSGSIEFRVGWFGIFPAGDTIAVVCMAGKPNCAASRPCLSVTLCFGASRVRSAGLQTARSPPLTRPRRGDWCRVAARWGYRPIPGVTHSKFKRGRFVTDASKAIGHSNSRNNRVVQVVSFFSLIRAASRNLATAHVLVEAAQRQLFRSPDGYQAAHYLPGQLKIGKQLPWMLIPTPVARSSLECLFADVEHLPAAFNIADSAAEEKGLREVFRAAAEAVIRDPRHRKKARSTAP